MIMAENTQQIQLEKNPLLSALERQYGLSVGPRHGVGALKGETIYHDFDWAAFFGKDERRFKGQKAAAEILRITRENQVKCSFVFLTKKHIESIYMEFEEGHDRCIVISVERLPELNRISRLDHLRARSQSIDQETRALLDRIPQSQRGATLLSLLIESLQGASPSEDEVSKLVEGVSFIISQRLTTSHLMQILNRAEESVSVEMTHELMTEYPDIVRLFVESEYNESDLQAFAYRRGQIDVFRSLLTNPSYFKSTQEEWGKDGSPEGVWQYFFECNPWIFGYGLSLKFLTPVGERLEQTTTGSTLEQAGKRTDALMQTSGAITSLCYVEIKHHRTRLCSSEEYRSGCFAPSREVSGGVCQIQTTVETRDAQQSETFTPKDREGRKLGEIYHYKPRSFLVVGSLAEFIDKSGQVAMHRFRSFQLYRRNILSPEILTFDELYERARHIIGIEGDTDTQIPWPKGHALTKDDP